MARVNSTGGAGFAVDNGTGLQVRTKLQQVIDALRSLQSGSGDPTVGLGAYQLHVNEVSNTSQVLKIRNKANDGFVEIGDVLVDGTSVPHDILRYFWCCVLVVARLWGWLWEIREKSKC